MDPNFLTLASRATIGFVFRKDIHHVFNNDGVEEVVGFVAGRI